MTGDARRSDFLDLVYEAALDPNLWVGVMEGLADLMGADAASLLQSSVITGRGAVLSARADPARVGTYFQYYAHVNPLLIVKDPVAYSKAWSPKILTDEDWMPRADLVRTEYYNDFLKPGRFAHLAMIRLALHSGEVVVVNMGRREEKGRFTRRELAVAKAMHPHLIRAFDLGRKLTLTRYTTEGTARAFDRSSDAMFLVDDTGAIRHANEVGEDLLRVGLGLDSDNGRLSATTPDLDRRLTALIRCAGSPDPAQRKGGSMALHTSARRFPLSITAIPVQPDRLPLFADGPAVLVCVCDPSAGVSLSDNRLGEMFRLTAAESRVALALFEGLSLDETAERFGVAVKTVRVQLSSIFVKTGTHRQAELVRLLANTVMLDIA